VRASGPQSLFCATLLFTVLDVNGDQDTSAADLAFVVFGLVLRDSEAHQCARHTTDRRASSDAAQSPEQRACREKRTHAGDGQRADARENPERPADDTATSCPHGCAFRRFRIFLRHDVTPHRRLVREQRGDIAWAEADALQRLDRRIGTLARVHHTDHRALFRQWSAHGITSN
jgi:hypothetical protein